MRLSQPVGQKRHTNIAIVSVRKKVEGKEYKFEIACYPNKVVNQREGLEKNLDQVLQTETVFTNVARGDIATNEDLITVFGTTNHLKVCQQIIQEGHLQVSDKEREYMAESRQRDIITMLMQMTMDAQTGYPLTATQLQTALDDVHYRLSAKTNFIRSSKEEDEIKVIARDAMKRLEAQLPHRIARVNMIIKLVAKPESLGIITSEEIDKLAESRCVINKENDFTFLITCHPSLLKHIKDSFGDKHIESLTVVDSFVHQILPNTPPPPVLENTASPVINMLSPTLIEAKIDLNSPKTLNNKNTTIGGHTCATCGNVSFASTSDFRAHCKSEWHAFNKKRQVKNLPPMDHLEFELLPDVFKSGFNAVDP